MTAQFLTIAAGIALAAVMAYQDYRQTRTAEILRRRAAHLRDGRDDRRRDRIAGVTDGPFFVPGRDSVERILALRRPTVTDVTSGREDVMTAQILAIAAGFALATLMALKLALTAEQPKPAPVRSFSSDTSS